MGSFLLFSFFWLSPIEFLSQPIGSKNFITRKWFCHMRYCPLHVKMGLAMGGRTMIRRKDFENSVQFFCLFGSRNLRTPPNFLGLFSIINLRVPFNFFELIDSRNLKNYRFVVRYYMQWSRYWVSSGVKTVLDPLFCRTLKSNSNLI